MKDSSDILIHEIIDDYQCPFTASEVHGFFTGLGDDVDGLFCDFGIDVDAFVL